LGNHSHQTLHALLSRIDSGLLLALLLCNALTLNLSCYFLLATSFCGCYFLLAAHFCCCQLLLATRLGCLLIPAD
jgi:hypothetical protein